MTDANHDGVTPEEDERYTDEQRKAANRERVQRHRDRKRIDAEKARRDDEYVAREVAITRARYADTPGSLSTSSLDERVKRTEEYARKWLAGEIGPRSTG